MSTLADLRAAQEGAYEAFATLLSLKFPGAERWHWFRACAAVRGENVRRNDDCSNDAAMAADESIRAAWDAYIVKLHAFYRARDGEGGVLGGRGL